MYINCKVNITKSKLQYTFELIMQLNIFIKSGNAVIKLYIHMDTHTSFLFKYALFLISKLINMFCLFF